MRYFTVKEIAEKWNLTERCVQNYCTNEKIAGAKQIGKQWLIPSDAEQPLDGRKRKAKENKVLHQYHFPIFIYSTFYNSKIGLSNDELTLLKAQKLHLEGEYAQSINICKKLLKKSIPSYLAMGVYCTIGFDSLMLGLHSEYTYSVSMMKNILKTEEVHNEDYKLITVALTYHMECNSKAVFDINPLQLSADALMFYKILLSLAIMLTGAKSDEFDMKLHNADCNYFESEGVTPAAFGYHCFLAIESNINGLNEDKEYHINSAIKMCLENNWISHLAKYYSYSPTLFEQYLSCFNSTYVDTLKNKNEANVHNWKIMYSLESGNFNCKLFSTEQTELLLLVSYGYSYSKIAKIKDSTVSQIKREIDVLCDIAKVDSKENLEKYGKKTFDNIDILV